MATCSRSSLRFCRYGEFPTTQSTSSEIATIVLSIDSRDSRFSHSKPANARMMMAGTAQRTWFGENG